IAGGEALAYLDQATGDQSGFHVAAHDAAVAHDLHEGAAGIEYDGRRRHRDAVTLRGLDGAAGERTDAQACVVAEEYAHAAEAGQLVDFGRHETHGTVDVTDTGDIDARFL